MRATLFDLASSGSDATAVAERPEPVPAGRDLVLESLPCRSALVRQRTDRRRHGWFDWSANPYRGCEFGCGYCYARYSHEWLGHDDPQDFQERIYVKQGFAEALRRDLRRVEPGAHVAFGTATDPYQPVERRERVTRAALSEFLGVSGLRLTITTKSTLVTRDIALLKRIAKRNAVRVHLSITTPDRRLARFLEPRAPTPDARFEALEEIRRAGLGGAVFLMPLLPGLTDAQQDLEELYSRAADADAEFVATQVVFLRDPARAHFLRVLRRRYPRVAARYEMWTRTSSRFPERVRRDLHERVERLARRHGFPERIHSPRPPRKPLQQTFGWTG